MSSRAVFLKSVAGLLVLMTTVPTSVCANDQSEDEKSSAIAEVFEAAGINATFVVAASDGEIRHVYNKGRSTTRFSPASTFKILNTLVALDTGVLVSKESMFSWDGIDKGLPAWNSDQTLQSAFRVSCVWCYQEIARKVGSKEYMAYLERVGYGNARVGDQVDQFWLNGELKISAEEQVQWLSRLYDDSLPFRPEHIDIVKEIMLDEQSADYALHAKTGWTGPELHVGWYVGYVETGKKTWLFAMNMRMDHAGQAALRKSLAIQSLQALGLLQDSM